jgi:glycosyltransferase involved in cell wall biosynthesis
VREQIEKHGLIDPERLIHAPLGVAAEFFQGDDELPTSDSAPVLLHVGSCIPRKRIDVLLSVVGAVRQHRSDIRLVQVGGEFTSADRSLISQFGLEKSITQVRGVSRLELARLYRAASLVLVTSEAEGFGLPVAEALACGAAVLASDIPVLREVGGDAASYAPVGDVDGWAAKVIDLLQNPNAMPDRAGRLKWGERYSWQTHCDIIAGAYARLVS